MRTDGRGLPGLDVSVQEGTTGRRLSMMAQALVGSEILRIAAEIRTMIGDGTPVCNLTVGDFSPAEFRIPRFLEANIREAVSRGETNYPPSDGMPVLKNAILAFYERRLGLQYAPESVVVTGGSRPGIYAAFAAVADPGDVVLYPVPSWNNNHYCHLTGAAGRPVLCTREDAFLPTRELLRDAVRDARLISLNSPLNPTGTAFSRDALEGICDLILEENHRRRAGERPLFLVYDQVYWMLTFGGTEHVHPVAIRPEMAQYTIFVDGISKAFAATGVRVGWSLGPPDIIRKMAAFLAHVGAWAPRAEQVATARLLSAADEIDAFQERMKQGIQSRLDALYTGLCGLREEGFPVDAIAPMGAMYLSARFALNGMRSPDGALLQNNELIREYLLRSAGLAVVPFLAFGSTEENGWFRLSVGAVSPTEIAAMFPRLRSSLQALSGRNAHV